MLRVGFWVNCGAEGRTAGLGGGDRSIDRKVND
jgi:hypothetical protein